jgi:predicted RNA-binding Zn-ribbon protein involved in translation (DUF1610 family)
MRRGSVMENRFRIATPPGIRAEARCAWCGVVELDPATLRVHVRSRHEGLVEYPCPSCGRLNIRSLDGDDLEVLDHIGVPLRSGRAPFELLEPHDGPSLSLDDLIDLHQDLSGEEDRRSPRHHRVRPGPGPVQERNAA